MHQIEKMKTWLDILAEYNHELDEKVTDYINCVLPNDSEIPRKYKELSLVAHSQTAIALASLSAGIPVLVEGLPVLERLE